MIYKLGIDKKIGTQTIRGLYPGIDMGKNDTGLGTIGKIDHAKIPAGITIKMHPHVNDDILSYFRVGKVKHTDSENITAEVSRNKLMFMQAGELFYHEEHMMEALEGLQIFIRPQKKNDVRKVSFYELEETDSIDQWRIIAAKGNDTPLQFTSETWIYDMKVNKKTHFKLPEHPQENLTALLYVFQGEVKLNNMVHLAKEESAIIENESVEIHAAVNSELVLFFTNANSTCYKGGMFSGNQF